MSLLNLRATMKWSRSNGYPVSFSARLKPLNKFSLQRLGMERVATDNRR